LVEINCVSPGGLPRINMLHGLQLEIPVIDFVEEQASAKKKMSEVDPHKLTP
jgi:glutathione synthase